MVLVPSQKFRFQSDSESIGTRLDQFLALRMEDFSRGAIRKAIDLGGVHVAGRRVRKCSHAVGAGVLVEVFVDGRALEPFELQNQHVLSQDPYLIVINKPAGVETQPTPARYRGTLYEALLRFLHNPFRPQDRAELGMVQRLDRDTSGVMVFSTHKRSHRNLSLAFTEREVGKIYLAIVEGRLSQQTGEFRSLLARNRASNLVRSVEKGGKEAITRYRVLQEFSSASLVEVELLTGRSHQIRAHFSEAGHPLLGDARYGGSISLGTVAVHRQMLHAARLTLLHPVSGKSLILEAPLPEDFSIVLNFLQSGVDDG